MLLIKLHGCMHLEIHCLNYSLHKDLEEEMLHQWFAFDKSISKHPSIIITRKSIRCLSISGTVICSTSYISFDLLCLQLRFEVHLRWTQRDWAPQMELYWQWPSRLEGRNLWSKSMQMDSPSLQIGRRMLSGFASWRWDKSGAPTIVCVCESLPRSSGKHAMSHIGAHFWRTMRSENSLEKQTESILRSNIGCRFSKISLLILEQEITNIKKRYR